ncbi:MAG: PD40 domain-containing protein [Muribaculaceae bacterium]|nr:PD40 domain-containing protein [Muribaculaceae bacterium]
MSPVRVALGRTFLSVLAAITSLSAFSETPRWLMNPSISPDGEKIAFSYKGEIFIVGTTGGQAFQLTSNQAYDSNPVWSPDGKRIVFLSNREGSDDIYITGADGGIPTRLTSHSGNETPLAFLNDSTLLFNASLLPGPNSSRAPFFTQLYSVNVNKPGSRPSLFLSLPVYSVSVNQEGDMLYQDRKSFEDPLRKHERSAGTSDIWIYQDGKFSQLTHFDGSDQSPVWGKGENFYYLSEKDGTMNVFETKIGDKAEKQLTVFKKHPVRSLSASRSGRLAFAWDGDIYTLIPGGQPQKVDIEINADLYDGDLVKNYVNRGVSNIAVSPNGNEVALIIRGDVYVTNSKYKTTKRITNTPAQERSVSFSSDGRTLVYDSDVDGIWQLFTAKIKNDEEKEFAYATDLEITPLYKCETSAMFPLFSPNGEKVAFLENRGSIKVIDMTTKQVVTALEGKYNYSYSDGDIAYNWSPDSEWLVTSYMGPLGWNNMDVALVKADGSEVIDLTESGYNDYNPKWALDGKAVLYSTGKYGMKATGSWGNQDDIILMVLDGDAWDQFNFSEEEADIFEKSKKDNSEKEENDKIGKGKKKDRTTKEIHKASTNLDLNNRRYRTKRLTGTSANIIDYYLTPKGDKLYYFAESPNGDYNLFVTDLKKGDTKILAEDLYGSIVPDKEGENIFIFSYSGVKKLSLPDGEVETVEFEAPYDRHPSLERQYIFDHMAKQVKDKFYDKNLHGVDWDYYTGHYREFLPYISNNRDFATLLSETLGELNASHTGGRFYGKGAELSTASLGAFFDDNYTGKGLKIVEIFPRGPLANKSADLKPGDIIMSIDGTEIEPGHDYFTLLEGKAGKKVRLEISQGNGVSKFITVKPLSGGAQTEMAYQRWVERNEQLADSLSGGRVGYVHVKGMDTESFQTVYERLLGKYRNHDAVVVDTRFNGGGWLHNDLALLLSGHKYVTFSPRGEEIGIEPFSQWTKPSVMLVNESNYSDAHGSPFVYQTLGIGEVVGAPVPGTMTAVWWETQIDPSLIFGIPQVTNRANDGTILENSQLTPDIVIYNLPGDVDAGIDAQLEGAVNHLMNKINTPEKP